MVLHIDAHVGAESNLGDYVHVEAFDDVARWIQCMRAHA